MSSVYEIEIGGLPQGEFDLNQIRQLAAEGALARSDRLRTAGGESWRLAAQLSDLWTEHREDENLKNGRPSTFPDKSRDELTRIFSIAWVIYVLLGIFGWCFWSTTGGSQPPLSWSLIVILFPMLLLGQLALMVALRWHPTLIPIIMLVSCWPYLAMASGLILLTSTALANRRLSRSRSCELLLTKSEFAAHLQM